MTRISLGFRWVAPRPPRRAAAAPSRAAGSAAAALAALCLLGPTARAADDWIDEEPSWIPSLRVGFDTFEYDTQATVQNNVNPPRNAGTQESASRRLQMQLGGELMGPILADVPGHPRLFAQAGTQFKPFSSNSIFDLGVGGDTEADINSFQVGLANAKARFPNNPNAWPLPPDAFLGEESQIDAEFQSLSWYASLGVAFTFPLADALLLEVKPLIAYNVDRIDMTGRITTAQDTGQTMLIFVDLPGTNNDGFQSVPVYEIHRGQASDDITQHSLGPGLELDLVLFRSTRPVRVSLYADARFLWVLGDRTTSFSDSVATYDVRRDGFGIRGGAGLRFSWVGFGPR